MNRTSFAVTAVTALAAGNPSMAAIVGIEDFRGTAVYASLAPGLSNGDAITFAEFRTRIDQFGGWAANDSFVSRSAVAKLAGEEVARVSASSSQAAEYVGQVSAASIRIGAEGSIALSIWEDSPVGQINYAYSVNDYLYRFQLTTPYFYTFTGSAIASEGTNAQVHFSLDGGTTYAMLATSRDLLQSNGLYVAEAIYSGSLGPGVYRLSASAGTFGEFGFPEQAASFGFRLDLTPVPLPTSVMLLALTLAGFGILSGRTRRTT